MLVVFLFHCFSQREITSYRIESFRRLFSFCAKFTSRIMKRSNKYEETRLGRILNGIGTDKVTLKCDVAIQRWFESTRLAFSSFLRKIYKAYYEETVSSIGRAADLRSVRMLSVRVRHCLFLFFLKGSINYAN